MYWMFIDDLFYLLTRKEEKKRDLSTDYTIKFGLCRFVCVDLENCVKSLSFEKVFLSNQIQGHS